MKITFLHTSKTHIKRFNKIVRKINKSIEVEHFVNEELLEHASQTGKVDKNGFQKELIQIRKNDNKFIVCTCSTYGDLCNENENVYRIDQPIVEFIVKKYSRIGIAYTLDSTKEKSKSLIEKFANKRKSIQIIDINCSHCWIYFEEENVEKYESEIANQIKQLSDNCEVVFLAQASMEGAKSPLESEDFEVVSSPEFGVRKYLDMIVKRS